ncbi:MAG: restriction endonuclease subunit S, partial [Planctomycetota bacterium]
MLLETVVDRLTNGYVGPTRSIYQDEGIPYLLAKHVKNNQLRFDGKTFVSAEFNEKHSKSKLATGDILLVQSGHIGAAAVVPEEHEGHNCHALIVITPKHDRVNSRYLSHFFNSSIGAAQFSRIQTGVTLKHLNCRDVKRLTIPLPPLTEQKRIADILDKADAIRRRRQESRVLLQDIPMAAFRDAFGDFLFPGQAEKPLTEIASVASGVAKGRKLHGAEIKEVPYLRVANVQAGYLDLTEIKTIPAKQSEIDTMALRRGDVVMTEGGDHDKLGRGALWEHDVPDCIHQNHVFRVRVDRNHLLPNFLVHYLQTELARNYFLRCAKKTTNLASINMTQLRALPVPLPPLELQNRYDQELRAVADAIDRQLQAEREADLLFSSLVQR